MDFQDQNVCDYARFDSFKVKFKKATSEKPLDHVDTIAKLGRAFRSQCSRRNAACFLRKSFPFVHTLRCYNMKEDLPNDIISGLTVGVMQIPHGMAYAMLSSLPPICGLYISFFGPLVYFFLGTSRHVSMGCISIVSLMIGSVLDITFPEDTQRNMTSLRHISDTAHIINNSYFTHSISLTLEKVGTDTISQQKIELASSMSLISGVTMIILGRLGFGIVTTYMPEPMVSGFTSGVAVQIITSQAKHIFGLDVQRYNGYFRIIRTWIDIVSNINHTQWLPLVIFAVSFIILYIVKVQINLRYKHRLKIPIPADLIVVVLATVVTYFGKFDDTNDLTVVKDIPAGFPMLSVPDLNLALPYLKDAFMIGVVAFTQTVSIAKIMAQTHNHKINPNQEMVAYGAGSVICCLFSGYIPAGSVGRSMVQEGAGGRTQVASLFGCLVVLVVIVAVGPLFYYLPKCVLSAVVLMSLRGMFLQFIELPSLWRKSKFDFVIWIVTAGSTVILEAETGIIVGIAFSIFTVTLRTQRAYGHKSAFVGPTNVIRHAEKYYPVRHMEGVSIIQYHAPVYFANAEHFVRTVYQKSGVNPKIMQKRREKEREITVSADNEVELNDIKDKTPLKTSVRQVVIIDFSSVNFLDLVGTKTLKRMYEDYRIVDIDLFLVECNDEVIQTLGDCGLSGDLSGNIFTSMDTLFKYNQSTVKDDRDDDYVIEQDHTTENDVNTCKNHIL